MRNDYPLENKQLYLWSKSLAESEKNVFENFSAHNDQRWTCSTLVIDKALFPGVSSAKILSLFRDRATQIAKGAHSFFDDLITIVFQIGNTPSFVSESYWCLP